MAAKIKTFSSAARQKHRPKGVSKKSFEKTFWPYLPIVIASVLLLGFGQNVNLSAAIKHPHGRVLAYASSMSVGALLADTNAQRSSNGVSSLTLNDKLDAAAQAKANDMASRNYWSHNTPEGNPPWVFVSNQGYSYQKLGENLAAGFSDEQSTISGWMASPPHRENLLDPSFTEVGFGYANNPDYTSAGGGPMTIVVSFYGKPQVLASSVNQIGPPVSSVTPKNTPSPTPTPASSPAPTSSATDQPPEPIANQKNKVPNTTKQLNSETTPSRDSSHAQVAFASTPVYNIATGLAVVGLLATLSIWSSKHLLTLRRFLVNGEHLVISHPIADVGLVLIVCVFYLLTQTAGFVR